MKFCWLSKLWRLVGATAYQNIKLCTFWNGTAFGILLYLMYLVRLNHPHNDTSCKLFGNHELHFEMPAVLTLSISKKSVLQTTQDQYDAVDLQSSMNVDESCERSLCCMKLYHWLCKNAFQHFILISIIPLVFDLALALKTFKCVYIRALHLFAQNIINCVSCSLDSCFFNWRIFLIII